MSGAAGVPRAPEPPRSPWQLFYGAMLAARRRRWARRAERLPVPVVSIGNLHWGGGGKTPFTIALAAHLRDAGRRAAVLSRGYGRTSRGALVVSRGDGPLVDVAAAGDEPHLVAASVAGVGVVVGERRVEAGRLALAELTPTPDVLLLDDAFSHVRLARDLDLLVFPASDPWAGGRLVPSGRLREPLAAARHAHAVVLTGVAGAAAPAGSGAQLAVALRPHGYEGPGFTSRLELGEPRRVDGAPWRTGAVLAVAGIARPAEFFAAAADGARRGGGDVVATFAVADHHSYPERTVREIEERARAAGATNVLTTEKDAAKLVRRLSPAFCLAVLPATARPEPAFWAWIDHRLAAIR